MALRIKKINKNFIPDMTNPLGKHWDQPDKKEIIVDDTYALMSEKSFKALMDYSRSQPSGVYEGKMWKAQYLDEEKTLECPKSCKHFKWFLCWFGLSDKPNFLSNNYREILIIED